MRNYLALMRHIMLNGEERTGRNGVTRAVFCESLRWDLRQGFPILTTKRVAFKAVAGELLWFLSGSTDNEELKRIMGYPPEKETIWSVNEADPKWQERRKQFGYAPGSLGRIYGQQWRRWRGARPVVRGPYAGLNDVVHIDQIDRLVEEIRSNPNGRRLLVTAWNPADLEEMALSACHVMFQCFCHPDNGLSLSMIQRSCDVFLGVPFNISSHGLLLCLLARVTGRYPRDLCITFQDCHIYASHYEQVALQLERDPDPVLPDLAMDEGIKELSDFRSVDQVKLVNYNPQDAIKAEMIL